jgi:hypothetical protein
MKEMINPEHPYQLYTDNFENSVEELGTGAYSAAYLSWSICWDKMKQLYPTARHEMVPYTIGDKVYMGCYAPDGSLMVHCKIFYETPDGNEYVHNEYLAVRDKRKNAMATPNSAEIENTYRRALAKGVSTLTGFGLSLWTNEDIKEIKNPPVLAEPVFLTGNKPLPGMTTIDQQVILERYMTDKHTTDADVKRIKKMKKEKWITVSKAETELIIADINIGRQNSMELAKLKKIALKSIKDNKALTGDQKKATEVALKGMTTHDQVTVLIEKVNNMEVK